MPALTNDRLPHRPWKRWSDRLSKPFTFGTLRTSLCIDEQWVITVANAIARALEASTTLEIWVSASSADAKFPAFNPVQLPRQSMSIVA